MKTWSDSEAEDLIKSLEAEFEAHLSAIQDLKKSEKAKDLDKCGEMKKADDKSSEPSEDVVSEKATEEVTAEPSQAAPAEASASMSDATSEVPADTAAEPTGDSEIPSEGQEGQEQSEEQEIEQLYSSMTEDEKKMHYEILKKLCASDAIEKSGKLVTVNTKDLMKSEFDVIKAENAELKKNLDQIISVLNSKVQKAAALPKQKAVTELAALNKSEEKAPEMDKKQIDAALVSKVKEGKLTKSESDQVLSYFNNKLDFNKIKHFLNK